MRYTINDRLNLCRKAFDLLCEGFKAHKVHRPSCCMMPLIGDV